MFISHSYPTCRKCVVPFPGLLTRLFPLEGGSLIAHAPAAPLAPLEEALAAFRQQYPTFDPTRVLDELRVTDYARLDTHKQVYLDYTGGGLYAERQVREYVELLSDNVFGNPHSTNPASQAMTVLVDRARRAVLDCYALQEEANQCGLSVRSGCFCNPGVREIALGFVRENLAASFREKEHMTYEQFLEVIDDQKQGALRVSLGLATTFTDVYRFLQFAQTFINRSASSAGDESAQMDERRQGDTTVIAPRGKKGFVARVCACGYQDNRLDKSFCPYCGRPLQTVQLKLSEMQPEASPAGKGQEQKERQ